MYHSMSRSSASVAHSLLVEHDLIKPLTVLDLKEVRCALPSLNVNPLSIPFNCPTLERSGYCEKPAHCPHHHRKTCAARSLSYLQLPTSHHRDYLLLADMAIEASIEERDRRDEGRAGAGNANERTPLIARTESGDAVSTEQAETPLPRGPVFALLLTRLGESGATCPIEVLSTCAPSDRPEHISNESIYLFRHTNNYERRTSTS